MFHIIYQNKLQYYLLFIILETKYLFIYKKLLNLYSSNKFIFIENFNENSTKEISNLIFNIFYYILQVFIVNIIYFIMLQYHLLLENNILN
jgi:hypothetical protein